MTLAATTSLVFGYLLHDPYFGPSTLVTGLPTLVVGTCWAALLRWREEVKLGRWKPRLGWLLSVPLAALNGALAGGILIASEQTSSNEWFFKFLGGAFMGSTFGIIVWLPALMVTLLLFGLPIARAQKAALQGFSGEERGERTLCLTNVVLSALVLAGVALAPAGEATCSRPSPLACSPPPRSSSANPRSRRSRAGSRSVAPAPAVCRQPPPQARQRHPATGPRWCGDQTGSPATRAGPQRRGKRPGTKRYLPTPGRC